MNFDDTTLEPARITTPMRTTWKAISNWSMFFSILGFIGLFMNMIYSVVALFGVMDLYTNARYSRYSGSPTNDQTPTYILIAVAVSILFLGYLGMQFMKYFLQIRFASKVKNAMAAESQEKFESAWRDLRNSFRLTAIMVLIQVLFVAGFVYYLMLSPMGHSMSRLLD